MRYFLERNVEASGVPGMSPPVGWDRGIVIENLGTFVGHGPAFAANGFTTGLQLTEWETTDPDQYIFLRAVNDNAKLIRFTRPGWADWKLYAKGQGLVLETNNPTFNPKANFMVNGSIGVNTLTPQQSLDVEGLIGLQNTDFPGSCNTNNEGAIYYDLSLKKPCFCNSVSWKTFDDISNC